MPLQPNSSTNIMNHHNFEKFIMPIYQNALLQKEQDSYELTKLFEKHNRKIKVKVYLILSFHKKIINNQEQIFIHSQRLRLINSQLPILQKFVDYSNTHIGICLTDLNIANKNTYLLQKTTHFISQLCKDPTMANEILFINNLSKAPHFAKYRASCPYEHLFEINPNLLYILKLFLKNKITIYPKELIENATTTFTE